MIGFVGSRRVDTPASSLVRRVVLAFLRSGAEIAVGCSEGVDAVVIRSAVEAGFASRLSVFAVGDWAGEGFWRLSAFPAVCVARDAGARVFWRAGGVFGSLRVRLARRTEALVRAVAGSSGRRGLVAFVASPCPLDVAPSSRFAGFGSGSWGAVALAVGLGLPVVVFPVCGAGPAALPGWWGGHWVPVASSGLWASAFRFVPLSASSPSRSSSPRPASSPSRLAPSTIPPATSRPLASLPSPRSFAPLPPSRSFVPLPPPRRRAVAAPPAPPRGVILVILGIAAACFVISAVPKSVILGILESRNLGVIIGYAMLIPILIFLWLVFTEEDRWLARRDRFFRTELRIFLSLYEEHLRNGGDRLSWLQHPEGERRFRLLSFEYVQSPFFPGAYERYLALLKGMKATEIRVAESIGLRKIESDWACLKCGEVLSEFQNIFAHRC